MRISALVMCFLLLAYSPVSVWAQGALDEEILEKHAEDSDFQYGPEPIEKGQDFSESRNRTSSMWRYIFYAALALGLGGLIYLLLRRTLISRGTSLAREELPLLEQSDDLHRQDFGNLRKKAEERQDWRLALRLHYLHVLQALSIKEFIQWQSYKTDREYLLEIKNQSWKTAFAELIRYYQYAWYGERTPPREEYERQAQLFDQFRQRIG